MTALRITQLTDADGYWQARVTVNGTTHSVDRKYGSWEVLEPREIAQGIVHVRRNVLPTVAAALQDRVRKEERKIARGKSAPR